MAKEHLIVNGFRVPGGYGGVAVRRACELIIANPGISQVEVLKLSVFYSGINHGTAGWITSPGPKSPATLLWDRRKEGVFRCYPNEHTEKVTGAQVALTDEFIRFTSRNYRDAKFHPKPGDLVRSSQYGAEIVGIFLGYQLGERKSLRSTVAEWIAERPDVEVGERLWMIIMENGSNLPTSIWNFGAIQPV
jgi:hypothetical protein